MKIIGRQISRNLIIVFLVLVLAAVLTTGVCRALYGGKTDIFTVAIAKMLRLSAFKINGEHVLYTDYVAHLKSLEDNNYGKLSVEQMQAKALVDLAEDSIVINNAHERGLRTDKQEIESLKKQLLQQFFGQTDPEKELAKRFNCSVGDIDNKILKPIILRNKLAMSISTDPVGRAAVKQQAQKVLDQIKAGADFFALAKTAGDADMWARGGYLGWLSPGDMVPEFDTVAFSLKPGTVSPELMETMFGYHIIRVNAKKIASHQIEVSQILFRFPSVEYFLKEKLAKIKIKFYLKIENPFGD